MSPTDLVVTPTCKYFEDHPVIALRLEHLDQRLDDLEQRVVGIQAQDSDRGDQIRAALEAQTKEISNIAVQVAGLQGRVVGYVMAGSILVAVVSFLANRVFHGGP